MKIPFRTARAAADERYGVPFFTPAQRERHAKIISIATDLMARYGKDHISMGHVAHALRIGVHTLRWHFSDLDEILHEILRAHLSGLARFMGDVPRDTANRRAAQRAAFVQYTRGHWGGFTEVHMLLIQERFSLPADLRGSIDDTYHGLGQSLAGEWYMDILEMLDTTRFDLQEIEARYAMLSGATPLPPGAPAPPPCEENHPAVTQTPTPIPKPPNWPQNASSSRAELPPPQSASCRPNRNRPDGNAGTTANPPGLPLRVRVVNDLSHLPW